MNFKNKCEIEYLVSRGFVSEDCLKDLDEDSLILIKGLNIGFYIFILGGFFYTWNNSDYSLNILSLTDFSEYKDFMYLNLVHFLIFILGFLFILNDKYFNVNGRIYELPFNLIYKVYFNIKMLFYNHQKKRRYFEELIRSIDWSEGSQVEFLDDIGYREKILKIKNQERLGEIVSNNLRVNYRRGSRNSLENIRVRIDDKEKKENNKCIICNADLESKKEILNKNCDKCKENGINTKNFDSFINSSSINVREFCKKIFNRESKSILKELRLKWTNDGVNDKNFIYWCLVLPQRETLEDSSLRDMLRYNRFYTIPIVDNLDELIGGELLLPFERYSEERLKIIFSKNYIGDEYVEVLNIIKFLRANNIKFNLPSKAESVRDLLNYLRDLKLNSDKDNYYFELNKLDAISGQSSENFTYRMIPDYSELKEWGKEMSHCISQYAVECKKGDTYLIGVLKDGKKYANVEIRNNKIRQIRKKANALPADNERDEILKFLNQKLNLL